MGFLDGVSNTVRKLIGQQNAEESNETSNEQQSLQASVFGDDIDEDGIGDNIVVNKNNVIETSDGYYVEVDSSKNNSLYAIMANTYENWNELSKDEKDQLLNAVMDANPEIFGTSTNSASEQYVSDGNRNSMLSGSDNRTERMHSYIYAGDKIRIPTKDERIQENSVKVVNASETNNAEDREHIHVGTVIATPHGTQELVYEPDADKAELKANDSEGTSLKDVVLQHFDENADDATAYAIALDQAKANSDLVLERINEGRNDKFSDVASIPQYLLLNADLYSDKEGAVNELNIVESRYEDFEENSDLTSARYVDKQLYTSDVSDVVINPDFDGENGEVQDGKQVYKSTEDAILALYKTDLNDNEIANLGTPISSVEEDNSTVKEDYGNGVTVIRDAQSGEIISATKPVEKNSDAFAVIMDGLKDNAANSQIVQGLSGQDAIDALNNISEPTELNMQPTEIQRIAV